MPVKEITVFKDGHAFMLHSGKMPADAPETFQMDYLPNPVLGTFWAYSADKNVRLSAVTSSQRRGRNDRTALSLQELIEANSGADVVVTEVGGKSYSAYLGFLNAVARRLSGRHHLMRVKSCRRRAVWSY